MENEDENFDDEAESMKGAKKNLPFAHANEHLMVPPHSRTDHKPSEMPDFSGIRAFKNEENSNLEAGQEKGSNFDTGQESGFWAKLLGMIKDVFISRFGTTPIIHTKVEHKDTSYMDLVDGSRDLVGPTTHAPAQSDEKNGPSIGSGPGL
jgi:hypothetical protein